MRGTAYAVTEILAFLIIATLIGIAAGWLLATLRKRAGRPAEGAEAAGDEPASVAAQLASATQAVDAGQRLLDAAKAETAELRQDLSVARWQVNALEEELARVRDGDTVR